MSNLLSCSLVDGGLNLLFTSKMDRYGGLHYDTRQANPESIKSFGAEQLFQLLKKDVEVEENRKKLRAIWFRITRDHTLLVEPLVKLGFHFHHTKGDYIVMVKSITGRDNIPKYAYTNVGVGGFVVNDQNQVLIVKEKIKSTNFWKFPGGYVEQGEELSDAVMREVFEETGIKTRFQCILTMRHLHQAAFNCSDLYFVCLLHATSDEVKICPHEIDQCQWVNIENVRQHLSAFNSIVVGKYLEWKTNPFEIGFEPVQSNKPALPSTFNVYSIQNKKQPH